MAPLKTSKFFARVDDLETRYCILLNSSSRQVFIRLFFRAVSRLGDGVFWYVLIAFLPYLNGSTGAMQAAHILITGLCGVLIYKILKLRLVRDRPFISCAVIQQAAPTLDRYSFPSGHTMHAFSFSIMLSFYMPEFTSLVCGFTVLVALSRVILGLHYPTDVVAGASLGSSLALLSLFINSF